MIQIRNLKKYYKNKLILDIPYLNLKEGNIYSIIGKNGAGKTTLFNILSGLLDYDKGELSTNFENTIISPQDTLFFKGSVFYNLTEPFNLGNRDINYNKIDEFLELFEIKYLKHSDIEVLSGGEKSKVQFIRTLMYNKKIMLLDEPTASIDKKSSFLIEELILKLKTKGYLIIIITHDLEQAFRISDYIYEIENTKIFEKEYYV